MNGADRPVLALSVRQPWAWLIIHGGKDWENRTWPTRVRGRVLIHAAKRMEQAEWEAAVEFHRQQGFTTPFPAAHVLRFGGVIGSVDIVDCKSDLAIQKLGGASKWFQGPWGFKMANPTPCQFIACKGALGFFDPGVQP